MTSPREGEAVNPAEAALHRAIAILLAPVPTTRLDETAPPVWVSTEGQKPDPESLY
jgi:hypothetical protein